MRNLILRASTALPVSVLLVFVIGIEFITSQEKVRAPKVQCFGAGLDATAYPLKLNLTCGTQTATTTTPAALQQFFAKRDAVLLCDVKRSGSADCDK